MLKLGTVFTWRIAIAIHPGLASVMYMEGTGHVWHNTEVNKMTINKFLIIGALFTCVVVGIVAWWFFMGSDDPSLPNDTLPFGILEDLPSVHEEIPLPDTLAGNTLTLSTKDGKQIPVKNFLLNGTTVADVVNPGFYVLAGKLGYCLADGTCLSGAPTTQFFIWYNVHSQFFYIILLERPLGAARRAAELFLQESLKVVESDLCRLNYTVGVPLRVDAGFSGQELGLSFCPGNEYLPEY
jgi:hypothetical protein